MSCLFGKSLSIFSLSQMSFNYALTHDYRRNSNDYLCQIRGRCTKTLKQLCIHYYPDENVILPRRSCWQAGGSPFPS